VILAQHHVQSRTQADTWLKELRRALEALADNTPVLTSAQRREVQDLLVSILECIFHESAG
jgi:hypothetical protein